VADVYSDNDVSASNGKVRPAYARLLRAAETGQLDVIVSWAVDRLTRRLVELEHLIDLSESTGVTVATVSGDLDLT
jgi:DNA invertase Pin-like site-specific DNA recombinase